MLYRCQQIGSFEISTDRLSTTTTTTEASKQEVNRTETPNLAANQLQNIIVTIMSNLSVPETQQQSSKRKICGCVKVSKRSRGVLNPTLISIAIITTVISNQWLTSLTTTMTTNGTVGNSNSIIKGANNRFINLVQAVPAPDPSASSSKSSTSRARGPPINGSIFGKRSLDNNKTTGKAAQKQPQPDTNDNSMISSLEPSSILKQLEEQNQHLHQTSLEANNIHRVVPRPQPTPSYKSSPVPNPAVNYMDIITETIEEFLALNNESNPEKASVAFCRMIVYECSQMLSARSRAQARRLRRRIGKSITQ